MGSGFQVRVARSVGELPASAWDALLAHEPDAAGPFVRHAFLSALEESGSASPSAGWSPRHLTLWRGGRLVAAAPAWLRGDSDGDFSRDFGWAAAAERARLRYSPKLVMGVPRVTSVKIEPSEPCTSLRKSSPPLVVHDPAGDIAGRLLRQRGRDEPERAEDDHRQDDPFHAWWPPMM